MACAIGGTVHLRTQHISERGIGRRKTGIWQLPSQIHPRATLVEAATRTNASFIGFVETQSSFKARQIKLCSSGRRHVDKIRFKSQKAPESEGSAINLSENPKQMISISTEKKKKKGSLAGGRAGKGTACGERRPGTGTGTGMGWDGIRAGSCGCPGPGLDPGPGLEPGSPHPGPAPAARCRAAPPQRPRRRAAHWLRRPAGRPISRAGGRARGGAALSALPRRAGARFVCALPSERGLCEWGAPAARGRTGRVNPGEAQAEPRRAAKHHG